MKRCEKLLTQFQRLAGAQDGGDPEEQSISEGCKWQQHKRRGDWWSSQFSHALIIYYYTTHRIAVPPNQPKMHQKIGLRLLFSLAFSLISWVRRNWVNDHNVQLFFFSAFTLILPLFPALIGHYRENDSSGLFAYLETKVFFFSIQGWLVNMWWLGWRFPRHGGSPGTIQHRAVWWIPRQCLLFSSGNIVSLAVEI